MKQLELQIDSRQNGKTEVLNKPEKKPFLCKIWLHSWVQHLVIKKVGRRIEQICTRCGDVIK